VTVQIIFPRVSRPEVTRKQKEEDAVKRIGRERCEGPIAECLWKENRKGWMDDCRRRSKRIAARNHGGWCAVNVDGEGLVDVVANVGGRGGGR
jgi:hypothetical protein